MKNFYKLLSLLMMLSLMLSVFAFSVSADDVAKEDAYEWEYDENTEILKNRDREYKKYNLPLGYKIFSKNVCYAFENSYSYNNSLYSYARDGEIVWTGIYSSFVYATRVGIESIENLRNGKYSGVVLYFDESTSELDDTFLFSLDSNTSLVSVELDVTKLSADLEYQIRAYDETGSISYVYGAVYEYEGENYYINYKTLSNNYFDSDGNLSYRSGTVTAKKLKGDLLARFATAKKSLAYNVEYVYEDEELDLREPLISPETLALIRFWVIFIAVAVVPSVFICIKGGIRLKKSSFEHKKLWLILCIGAALWVAFAVATALVLIFG